MRRCRFDEYGRNCENKCSSTCKDNYCRNEDGKCLRCPPGVQGHNCTTENATPGLSAKTVTVGVIVTVAPPVIL